MRVRFVVALAAILCSLAAMPGVEAQSNFSGSGGSARSVFDCVPPRELVAIAGFITASEITACLDIPVIITAGAAHVNGAINIGGPDIPAGGIAGFAIATSGFTECTYGSEGILIDNLAAGTGAAVQFVIDIPLNVDWCDGVITATVNAGAVPITLARFRWQVGISRDQAVHAVISCDAPTTAYYNIDPTDSCARPVSTQLSPLCSATNSTLAAYAPTSTTCNPAFIKNSVAITSWPVLNAVLSGTATLAGTITVNDDSGGWAIHQDALSGSVSICPESAPCYQVLSGSIDTNNTFSGNFTGGNMTMPTVVQVESATGDFFAPVILWIVGIWASMRLAKLMAAGACTIGLGFSLVAPGNLPLQILALSILGVVLWLEAFAREQIYARFFRPSPET